VDEGEARALRRTLPFVPFAPYDPTAGTSRLGGGDSDGSLLDPAGSALLVSEEGSEAAAAPSHLPQAITQLPVALQTDHQH
jgi:hypothetical protein